MNRKEAIEIVKKNFPNSSFTMLREALETLIPELKENEDENIRKEAISIIKQYIIICEKEGDKCYTADRVIAWLEKQGGQKYVWSEKDDTMIDKIIYDVTPLEECPDYPTERQRKFYDECNEKIEWLKSLKQKSHWKPTEEQLSSLKQAISYFGGELPKELQSLYDDLQKLLD